MSHSIDIESSETTDRLAQLGQSALIRTCVNGVTHDANNVMGAILAYSELIRLESELTPDSSRMLAEIEGAVTKCTDLLGKLTCIARKDNGKATVAFLQRIVETAVSLYSYNLKSSMLSFETSVSEEMAPMLCVEPRLVLAILQLLENAKNHLEDTGDNRPLIRLTVRETEDDFEVVVWNSGEAIPEQDRPHIFEPYFTTKGGEHLGLGLYTAREIAQLHDGDLEYDPEQGFIMRLPKSNSLIDSNA